MGYEKALDIPLPPGGKSGRQAVASASAVAVPALQGLVDRSKSVSVRSRSCDS